MSYYVGEERLPRISEFEQYDTLVQGAGILKTACNFECDRVVVSDYENNTANVYFSNTTAWNKMATFNNVIPGATTGFGISVAMDWDGNRIAIGANVLSNVYIYDYQNGNWNQRVIEGPPGTDFGYSVAIAGNTPDIICIGAPLGNNVHVYENIQGAWNETYRNNGNGIKNRLPVDATSNVILKYEYTAYGYHVNISPSGEYIIAGAPGTHIPSLNFNYGEVTNVHLSGYEVNGVIQNPINFTGSIKLGDEFYQHPPDSTRQIGNVRVLVKNGSNWNVSSSYQKGPDIEGFPVNRNSDGESWPAFGMCTYISDDAVAIVSSPMYSAGGDKGTGKVTRFLYDENVSNWVVSGFELISPYNSVRYGLSFAVDYSTGRIAVSGQNRETFLQGARIYPSHVHVMDWNGTEWFDAQPIMSLLSWSDAATLTTTQQWVVELPGVARYGDNIDISMVNGNRIICGSPRLGTVFTKHVDLTQNFFGNSLFSGYVMTPEIFVGTNNADSNNTQNKKISFGGTFRDQRYTNTTIENRTSQPGTARSELLLVKQTDEEYPDSIRIKANEIILDSFLQGNIRTRTGINFNDYQTSREDKYDIIKPIIVMNNQQNIAIRPTMFEDYDSTVSYFKSSCDAKATLDVGGTTLIKNNTVINYKDRSNVKGLNKKDPITFYDTRDTEILYTNGSETRVKSETIWLPPTNEPPTAFYTYGLVIGPAGGIEYSELYKSFELNNASSNIHSNPESGGAGDFVFSCWLMLKNDHNAINYNTVTVLAHKNRDAAEYFRLQITENNVILRFNKNTDQITLSPTTNQVLEKNVWYCLFAGFPRLQIPTASNTYLYINNVYQTLGVSTNGNSFIPNFGIHPDTYVGGFTGDSIVGAYIGLFRHWSSYNENDSPSPEDVYKNGSPTEMLSVGGDALIQRNLGVGTTTPTNILTIDSNDSIFKLATSTADTSYNYVLNAPKPSETSGGVVHFINGTNRTDDGGASTYTIRNDSGPLRLGNNSYQTTINGNDVYIGTKLGVGTVSPNAPLHVNVSGSSSDPSTTGLYVYNPTNSAGQDSSVSIRVAGSAAGDPFLSFDIYGEAGWAFGMDNSDGNKMKLGSNWNSVSNNTKLTVDTNGYVGIGVTNPQTILHLPTYGVFQIGDAVNWWDDKKTIIKNSTSWSLGQLNGYTLNSGAGSFSTGGITDWSIWEAYTGEGATIAINGDTIAMASPADNETINYYDEDTASRIWYISTSGNIISTSDIRRKTDIQPFTCGNSLESFKKLNTVNYKLKKPDKVTRETKKYDEVHSGFIAQEILEIFPECVKTDSDGYHSLDYRKFTLITINALKKEIEKREQLESQLASVLARLDALENK